jgi:hypothetical protein
MMRALSRRVRTSRDIVPVPLASLVALDRHQRTNFRAHENALSGTEVEGSIYDRLVVSFRRNGKGMSPIFPL